MKFLEKNLWLSLSLAVGVLVLVIAALVDLGGSMPVLAALRSRPKAPLRGLPDGVSEWFSPARVAGSLNVTNGGNAFYTLRFQVPPPPPPPATKKVELLYQGFLEASTGLRRAYVKVADAPLLLPTGARVVADHAIQSMTFRTLTLTNAAGQTNVLEFNVKKQLDVPAT